MNGKLKRIAARLLTICAISAAFALMGACTQPTGSTGSSKSTYEEDLASFVQAVGEITPLPADPDATEIFIYAITVEALAGVHGIEEVDVIAVVTDQIVDIPVRNSVLGVLDGSITLMDLMVADTGMYQDETEQIVIGLPLEEEIPVDSPIETHGTPTIVIVPDGERGGMEFDSAEDYLIIPADPSNDLTNHGTIEVWLKPDVNVSWAGIIHKGTDPNWTDEGYSFQYDGGKQLMLAMTREADDELILVWTKHVLATGVWSHVVATWDEDKEVQIYVNGVDVVDRVTLDWSGPETTIAENCPIKSSNGDVVVGTQIPGAAYRFDGVMSDIKIYARHMEESEVLEHYNE